jgi:hypothetical protein
MTIDNKLLKPRFNPRNQKVKFKISTKIHVDFRLINSSSRMSLTNRPDDK